MGCAIQIKVTGCKICISFIMEFSTILSFCWMMMQGSRMQGSRTQGSRTQTTAQTPWQVPTYSYLASSFRLRWHRLNQYTVWSLNQNNSIKSLILSVMRLERADYMMDRFRMNRSDTWEIVSGVEDARIKTSNKNSWSTYCKTSGSSDCVGFPVLRLCSSWLTPSRWVATASASAIDCATSVYRGTKE